MAILQDGYSLNPSDEYMTRAGDASRLVAEEAINNFDQQIELVIRHALSYLRGVDFKGSLSISWTDEKSGEQVTINGWRIACRDAVYLTVEGNLYHQAPGANHPVPFQVTPAGRLGVDDMIIIVGGIMALG